jgi:Transcription factor zinc-finger
MLHGSQERPAMSLFGEKCVRCGKRTRHVYREKPTCDPCAQQLELVLAASKEAKRACPADGAALGKEIAHGTIIDRCPTCRGVWLDAGELERLNGEIAYEACAAMVYGMRPPA